MELVTVQDAAALLNVSPKAIYYALTENKLTRHEKFGRVVLEKSEVEAYQPRAGANRPSKVSVSKPPTDEETTVI